MSITHEQGELIQFCIASGYGWKQFALSVHNSGRCSQKQEQTLQRMKMNILDARRRADARERAAFARKSRQAEYSRDRWDLGNDGGAGLLGPCVNGPGDYDD